MDDLTDATVHLRALVAGDRSAADRLAPLVYKELRAIAGSLFGHENAAHTLQPTAIVHEAFMKLIDQERAQWEGRSHFMAIAAVQMRRILVDHARQRDAAKRGGQCTRVSLSGLTEADAAPLLGDDSVDVEVVDRALTELASLNPRHAEVVQLRFYAGMSVPEVAAVLGVSEKTVKNDWRFARAWLHDRLSQFR